MGSDNVQKILQIIKNDEPQREYFFKVLASTDNPIPWLKIVKENGYLDPKDNPAPQEVPDKKGYFIIPRWNVLGFLENVANKNKEIKSDVITDLLIGVINSIINYRNPLGERTENYWTDWILTRIICTLPIERISITHIEFVGTALKSKWGTTLVAGEIGKTVLPHLISDKARELILKLLDVILDYRKVDKKIIEKFTSIMDEYWLNATLKKHKPEISRLCGVEAAKIALTKIRAMTDQEKSSFNIVWIPTIENHPQNKFPDKYECQLVHFVRDIRGSSKCLTP
jgi:hypothetical protein